MTTITRFLGVTVLLLAYIIVAGADDWTNYTSENSGLISNDVRAVCVDGNGVKWFGTDIGLARFDGAEWDTFRVDTARQTLAHNSIRDIVFEVTDYGPEIWVATDSGVSVMGVSLDGITMATPYRMDNTGLISNRVRVAAVDSSHKKWFGTDSGLSSFLGNWETGWASYTEDDTVNPLSSNDILSIGLDKTGWKYVGTMDGGVSRIFDKNVDAVTTASPYREWTSLLSFNIFASYATCVDTDTVQWFGTDKGAARHLGTSNKTFWDLLTVRDGLVNDTVQAIIEDEEGRIWFGTRGGVSVFQDWECTSLTADDGLVGNNVLDIAIDRDGSLWFATESGISHFTGQLQPNGANFASRAINHAVSFRLNPNYPNPFNTSTTISYELFTPGNVQLIIYNVMGQGVRTLVEEYQSAGVYRILWNGLSIAGEELPSGIYFCRLNTVANDWSHSDFRKMVLLK